MRTPRAEYRTCGGPPPSTLPAPSSFLLPDSQLRVCSSSFRPAQRHIVTPHKAAVNYTRPQHTISLPLPYSLLVFVWLWCRRSCASAWPRAFHSISFVGVCSASSPRLIHTSLNSRQQKMRKRKRGAGGEGGERSTKLFQLVYIPFLRTYSFGVSRNSSSDRGRVVHILGGFVCSPT